MKVAIQVLLFAVLILSINGCKKYNQVDNSGTVKTPYILYVGGYNGTLHKTNDALYFNTLFPTDGHAVRQVLVADTMLTYMKKNFYFSRNEGKAFFQSNDHTRAFEDLFFKYYLPNQAVYDNIDSIIYLCTSSGLEKSFDKGESFVPEANWDSVAILPTSITQTQRGDIYIIKDSASNVYKKMHLGWPVSTGWQKVTAITPLPKDTVWYISHKYDMLLAVDYYNKAGTSGIYYSLDGGSNWVATSGLPKKKKILFASQPTSTDNTFFAGLDSGGLWRLNGTTFEPSGQGIPWYAKVHFVVGKKVVYRTDVVRYYHFCATDVGLYMSENDGLDWRLIKDGAYSTLY